MSEPSLVLRCTSPDGVRLVEEARIQRRAAAERALAWAKSKHPDATTYGWSAFDGSFSINGLTAEVGMAQRWDMPSGWRYDKSKRAWVAAKRTDEGKSLDHEMAALHFPHPKILGLGGIVFATDDPPETPRHQKQNYTTGWTYRIHGDEAFAVLGLKYLDERKGNAVLDDLEHWEQIPLSAYHLAKEAAA